MQMGDYNMNEIFEIDFEVGHSSTIRSEVTTSHAPPHTHDWKIYLRSANINGDLNYLIRRCIFHLQPEYSNSQRELKSTPFAIQETGYAGFHLPIDIYFNTEWEPKMFRIEYDLDLHKNVDGHTYRHKKSYMRKYRCIFNNPDSEFRCKILAAGGKIVDTGPMPSNNTDNDESDIDEKQLLGKESIILQSSQQKRSFSPAPTSSPIINKKLKIEQAIKENKKIQGNSNIKSQNSSDTVVVTKRSKLPSHKSSSLLEEKPSKIIRAKESSQTISINNSAEIKSRVSSKMLKSQSTNDIASLSQTTVHKRKQEFVTSSAKPKSTTYIKNGLKEELSKDTGKMPKTSERPTTSTTKSTLKVKVKHEPVLQPSVAIVSSTNTKLPSSNHHLKKIPKKPVAQSTTEKPSCSPMVPGLSCQNSTRDTRGQQPFPSKTKSTLKKDRPSSCTDRASNFNRSEKRIESQSLSKTPTSKSSQKDSSNISTSSLRESLSKTSIPTLSEFIKSTSEFQLDPPTGSTRSSLLSASIDTYPDSTTCSPFADVPHHEDNSIQLAVHFDKHHDDNHIQCSDRSDSRYESSPTLSTKMISNHLSYSDELDTNDSDASINDDSEVDLPNILTNEDLRYKLIHIYKRFQLNSVNDLIIFVQFFKRHKLVDLSSLSTTKPTNDVFTYDLFSLSPSLIGELANDLGYQETNVIRSTEQ